MKQTVLSTLLMMLFVGTAGAADMAIYYSPTCPHCHHAKDYTNNNFIYEYPTIKVTTVDVTVPENRAMFIDVLKQCDFTSGGVPVIKIGDKCFQGFAENMADDMRSALESDLSDEAKKSAAAVKKAIAENGEAYRAEHPTPVATVSEYTAPADENVEKKTNASDNKLASWIVVILAILVLGFSIAVAHNKTKR